MRQVSREDNRRRVSLERATASLPETAEPLRDRGCLIVTDIGPAGHLFARVATATQTQVGAQVAEADPSPRPSVDDASEHVRREMHPVRLSEQQRLV